MYDDSERNLQRTASKDPYILFYEKVEKDQQISELSEEDPIFIEIELFALLKMGRISNTTLSNGQN